MANRGGRQDTGTVYRAIGNKVSAWIEREKEDSQSVVKILLSHIEKEGKLRPPQKEAIETYLWIKFVGNNRKLSDIIRQGLLYDDDIARDYDNYYTFEGNYVNQFLNQFFLDNGLKNIRGKLINDPRNDKWGAFLDELLHNFEYANYLYSLPMGAGKTFLMACFIYLDLYFADIYENDERFARNFVVFAPHAAKTAILPSLRTIKDFNPEWILPKNDAEKLKCRITVEVLDGLSSKRKDKLHGNNPNLEKVNRLKQVQDFGLVFITNAEKVVLEKIDGKDEIYTDPASPFYADKKAAEIKKINALREALSQIPSITVILDEVHHAYAGDDDNEKKLRRAVGIINQNQHVNAVIGMSGTPYVKKRITLDGEIVRLNQIQDVVYHYPLNAGIGVFLKTPQVKKSDVAEAAFLERALTDFFGTYDKTYVNGARSKIAFYCPSVEKLNEEVLPAIKAWYGKNRRGKEDEIFRYYSKMSGKNKPYALPKDSLAVFNNLDAPYSAKRVILLVAVGTEGWDCRSLTAVALPRQKTKENFVLQTTCRCLREVDSAAAENALVYLSPDNYETLDRELQNSHNLSISDLSAKEERALVVQVRKPKLGELKYRQIESKYKIAKRISPAIKEVLGAFKFSAIKRKYAYNPAVVTGAVGRAGLAREREDAYNAPQGDRRDFSYADFLFWLADSTYGKFSESELEAAAAAELNKIYTQLAENAQWTALNPHIGVMGIIKIMAADIMDRVEYAKEEIKRETVIELLQWENGDNTLNAVSNSGGMSKFMPRLEKSELKMCQKYPQEITEKTADADPRDLSFNYTPYKMDSEFEQNALGEMLKMAEMENLEVYFNGYKDARLESFWIQTPRGKYTPDFMILKRRDGAKYRQNKRVAIDKVLIIETKGAPYYNEKFKAKEKFVRETFLKHNKHFTYHCFKDDGGNDFSQHLQRLRELLANF